MCFRTAGFFPISGFATICFTGGNWRPVIAGSEWKMRRNFLASATFSTDGHALFPAERHSEWPSGELILATT